MDCDGNTGLNKESNFDRESMNRNVISNDNIHERDSFYTIPENSGMQHNTRNTVRKNHGWNIMLKGKERKASTNGGLNYMRVAVRNDECIFLSQTSNKGGKIIITSTTKFSKDNYIWNIIKK